MLHIAALDSLPKGCRWAFGFHGGTLPSCGLVAFLREQPEPYLAVIRRQFWGQHNAQRGRNLTGVGNVLPGVDWLAAAVLLFSASGIASGNQLFHHPPWRVKTLRPGTLIKRLPRTHQRARAQAKAFPGKRPDCNILLRDRVNERRYLPDIAD